MNVKLDMGGVPITGTITPSDESSVNPSELVRAWLHNIDPEELERVALENMCGLGGMGNGEAFIAALLSFAGET